MRKETLPVQIGKGLNKGLMVYKDIKNGGYSVMVVWLKRPYEGGEEFEIEDICKMQTVLHFCDKGSAEKMLEILNGIVKEWKDV